MIRQVLTGMQLTQQRLHECKQQRLASGEAVAVAATGPAAVIVLVLTAVIVIWINLLLLLSTRASFWRQSGDCHGHCSKYNILGSHSRTRFVAWHRAGGGSAVRVI